VKKSVNQLIFAVGVLVVWEALALAKIWPPYLFPTPLGVAQSLYDGFKDHSLWFSEFFWGWFWQPINFWRTRWGV
jgi:NitT/TauT family transport system permease protein